MIDAAEESEFELLLKQLKVLANYRDFVLLIEANKVWSKREKKAQLKRFNQHLREILSLVNLAKEAGEFNRKQILSWSKLFAEQSALDDNLLTLFDKSGQFIGCYKSYMSLALNYISLSLNLFSMNIDNVGLTSSELGLGITNSAMNIIANLITGAKQCRDGEVALGSLHIISAIRELSFSLTSYIGNKVVGTVSASTIPMLGSASMLAGLAIGLSIEYLQILRSNDRIKCISKRVETCDIDGSCEKLNQLLILEYANLESHKQKAASLTMMAVSVVIVTIISFTVLSGVSFGAVPAAVIILMATTFLMKFLTSLWQNSVSANQKLKKSKNLTITQNPLNHLSHDQLEKEANIVDVWNKIILGLLSDGDNKATFVFSNHFKVNLLEPINMDLGFFSNKKTTFKSYIDKLFVKYPEKAQAVITALSNKNYRAFQNALAMKQHQYAKVTKKTTLGCMLLRQLTIRPQQEEPPDLEA